MIYKNKHDNRALFYNKPLLPDTCFVVAGAANSFRTSIKSHIYKTPKDIYPTNHANLLNFTPRLIMLKGLLKMLFSWVYKNTLSRGGVVGCMQEMCILYTFHILHSFLVVFFYFDLLMCTLLRSVVCVVHL